MTTYRTGNPIGSADPRDLYDNAENLDELVNSQDKAEHPDRLGVLRKTWHGMEEEFDAAQSSREQEFRTFIASSGYQFAGDYAAGIEITQYNQLVRDSNGEFWRVSGQVDLPYVTTGTGIPEDDALVPAGDAVLRQELGAENGALMVRGAAIYVDTIADLQALDTSALVDGQQVQVKEYHAGTGLGGGEFYWDAVSEEADNGGTVLAVNGVTTGRWKRRHSSAVIYCDWFGPAQEGDATNAISSAVAYAPEDSSLIGPSHPINVSGIDINKTLHVEFPFAITRLPSAENVNALVVISADSVIGRFFLVDFNAPGQLDYSGRGETIRITGHNVLLRDTVTDGNPFSGGAQGFEIRGDDCRLERCISKNCGYAGFRALNISKGRDANGDPLGSLYLLDCEARNFRTKGFVANQDSGTITLDNFSSTFNESEAQGASEHILAENGAGYKLYKFIVKNSYLDFRTLSNGMKFVSTRYGIIENCRIVKNAPVLAFRYQQQYRGTGSYEEAELLFRDCSLIHNSGTIAIQTDSHDTIMRFENLRIGYVANPDSSNELIGTGAETYLNGAELSYGGTRPLFDSNSNDGRIEVQGIVNKTDVPFTLVRGAGGIRAGNVRFSNIAGPFQKSTSGNNSLRVSTNLGTPRTFEVPSRIPSYLPYGSGWEPGDKYYFRDTGPGDVPGLECVQGGTVGDDAVFVDMPALGSTQRA